MRRLLICVAVLMLGACQLSLPGSGGKEADVAAAGANPIVGDAIAVTSLDAPKAVGTAPVAAAPVVAAPDFALAGEVPPVDPADETLAATEAVVVIKTPMHLACEKRGGRWSMAGSSKASFCQTPTKDAGKSCRKKSDCSDNCLSISGTCAPFTPLFGCNEVLDDQGRTLTECIN